MEAKKALSGLSDGDFKHAVIAGSAKTLNRAALMLLIDNGINILLRKTKA